MADSAPGWREQYDRMLRWHARINEATHVDDRFLDECYAFFTCCFHVKDWLKADVAVPHEVRDLVEQYVERNLWLRLSADLANGSKHMILDHPRFDEPARVEKIGVLDLSPLAIMPVKPGAVIQIGADMYHPRHVADRCVAQWNTFLVEHGLATETTD
jgi:hypothetical protein